MRGMYTYLVRYNVGQNQVCFLGRYGEGFHLWMRDACMSLVREQPMTLGCRCTLSCLIQAIFTV